MRNPAKTNKINCTLLIDDDVINNFISEKILQKSQITDHIKIASNGEIAFKYLENCCEKDDPCPELILLDIHMPVMNGFYFLNLYKKLQSKNKGKIVILSDSDNPHDIEHLSQFEIMDYISKPLTNEKVADLMKKYYNSKQVVD